MDIQQALTEITNLPVADRLHVIETVWNSLDLSPTPALSPEQTAEIDRRLDAHEKHPEATLSWDEVLDQLRGES